MDYALYPPGTGARGASMVGMRFLISLAILSCDSLSKAARMARYLRQKMLAVSVSA